MLAGEFDDPRLQLRFRTPEVVVHSRAGRVMYGRQPTGDGGRMSGSSRIL